MFVKGRIVQHLEELERAEGVSTAELEERVSALRTEMEAIEEELDPDAERERVASRLSLISNDMTALAQALELEHSEGRVRLDAYALTVIADVGEPIPLDRMGSAGNWVGYHLVAHLALHNWFIEHNRPVPQFLMIDQPTQAFYPPDATEVAVETMDDADRAAVTRMFRVIHDAVEMLAPQPSGDRHGSRQP